MGERVAGIPGDGVLEADDGALDPLLGPAVHGVQAAQVGVVGLEVRGVARGPRLPGGADLRPQLGGHRLRDLVLDREDVVHLAVEPLGPDLVSVRGVDELRGDAKPGSRPAHASLEHGVHLQAPSDLPHVEPLGLDREGRGPRHDAQAARARRGC